MKFSIGDRIKLRQTGEEGIVIAELNKTMVEVEVNGTVFPAFIDELDHPYLDWFTKKAPKTQKRSAPEQLPVEKIKDRIPKLAKGVYLSFFPVYVSDTFEDVVDHLKIYLVNELPVDIKYGYEERVGDNTVFKLESTLHAFGNLYLHNVAYADMNDKPKFIWRLAHAGNPLLAKAEGLLKLKPEKLFEHLDQCLKNNEPAFSYLLITDFVLPPKKEKHDADFPVAPVIVKEKAPKEKFVSLHNLEPARHELDLHAEALIKNLMGMSNGDILKIQLDTLERYLHLAIAHRQHSMIVIHGLGKGTLKEEVHKILKATREVGRYKNEWSHKYGFGATEIIFRY